MNNLCKPNIKFEEVYEKCSSGFRDKELVKRYELCKNDVINAAHDYDSKAINNELFLLEETVEKAKILSKEELINLYELKFAKRNSPCRNLYDKLLLLPKHRKCPYCGEGVTYTIDHYLAKSVIPSLAVYPLNLIPSCRDCNFFKDSFKPKAREEEVLHPYFDNIASTIWLSCEIIETNPMAFRFYISNTNTDAILYSRLCKHLEVFNLQQLYSSKAGSHISNKERRFKEHSVENLKLLIKDDLEEEEAININSWQSALYRGLLESKWFFSDWLIHPVLE